ncbi:MAG: DNA-binding protein [Pseudomonadota bacterium]
MKSDTVRPEDLEWTCFRCRTNLVPAQVMVEYMGNRLTTELPVCPDCGFVLVSETVALGKMAEVEQILEDK